jgi:hypothetical protein
MATPNLRLDHSGIAQILKAPEVQALVSGAAERVAANYEQHPVVGGPIPVVVETAVTGRKSPRFTAQVVAKHPAADAVEAKYGALTRAATAAGFPLSTRKH